MHVYAGTCGAFDNSTLGKFGRGSCEIKSSGMGFCIEKPDSFGLCTLQCEACLPDLQSPIFHVIGLQRI